MGREERLAELTKERDGLVRVRREVQKKFDTVDVYLADFAKVSCCESTLTEDKQRHVYQGARRCKGQRPTSRGCNSSRQVERAFKIPSITYTRVRCTCSRG